MKRCLLMLLLLTLTAGAVVGQDIREIRIDTITGVFEPTQIGVDEVKYIGTRPIAAEDTTLMLWVTRVVQRDIDFYADFALVLLDSFYLATYEIKELTYLGWQRLGAEFVVKIEVEFPGPNMRAYWKLFHAPTESRVAKGTLEYNRAYWRELAHDIANEVVHALTGEQGIFRSKVAYIRKLGEAKELFVADYDGTNEKQLTTMGTINLSPSFAPGSNEIYFTSYATGDPELYKVSVASGEVKRLTDYDGVVAAPAVSPDGNKIACVLSKDGNSEIYVLDTNGRIIKRLTRHWAIDSAPSWSPDGRMIAFSSDRTGAPQVYLMDSDGLNTRRLTFEGGYNDSPIWSDRGDRVTFVSRTKYGRFDLASIDTSGTDYRILTEVGQNENPHFSPDGKHIIFSSSRLTPGDIYTMDLSGRNQRRLTRGGNCSNPVWGPVK